MREESVKACGPGGPGRRARRVAATALTGFALLMPEREASAQAAPPQPLPPTLSTTPLGERPEDRLRDLQRQQFRRDNVPVGPGVEIPARPPAGDASAATLKFKVDRIVITQSAVLPQATLRAMAARLEGREIVLEDLNRLTREITALYPAARFPVGFAILPPQKVEKGIVQIVLIEPRVDAVDVAPGGYTDPEYLRSRIPLKSGDLVDVYALESALTVLARTSVSGIRVAARLVPGSDFATSRIVLDVIEPPRHSILTLTDNYGTEESGEIRNQTVYRTASLLGRDDPLAVGVSFSKGSRSTFGIYDTPIGIAGTRLEFQYSLSDSRIIAGPFEDLDLQSDGQFASLQVRHPFFVDTNWLYYGLVETAYSNGVTETGPLETGTTIGRIAIGNRLIHYSEDGSIEVTGKAVFIGARAFDNIGDEHDSYVKFAGDLRAVRRLGQLTAIAEAAWQVAPSELLPSAEQFAFGGVSTLRAYEINQFNGDEGYWGRLELHGPGWGLGAGAVRSQ
ncbi:MAG: POTRA domain-containing protein [Hyphomicrobiaceae bacterium]|nr:POTRA domain-containing protein [Hyphomicrobiaceae bacterium]